jgi:hypothetical protein
MRTTDFSRAPRRAQATAMFIGSTRYNGPRDWWTLSRTWKPFVRRMTALPGYCWHHVYWEPPFTLGTMAYFDTMDQLLAVARLPEHRKLMRWVADGTSEHATAGFIRLYSVDEHGYTNGIWRAEDQSMSHIEDYTRLPGDQGPRPVDDASSEIA